MQARARFATAPGPRRRGREVGSHGPRRWDYAHPPSQAFARFRLTSPCAISFRLLGLGAINSELVVDSPQVASYSPRWSGVEQRGWLTPALAIQTFGGGSQGAAREF